MNGSNFIINIANIILLNYTDNVPIQLSDEQIVFVERMKMVYSTDVELLVEDWKNSFPDMTDEEARYTLDVFMQNHIE